MDKMTSIGNWSVSPLHGTITAISPNTTYNAYVPDCG